MDGSQILVEQIDVAARDLDGARAVPEDALEAEDVAAVGQERTREGMAQDVWGAAGLDACPPRQSMHELIRSRARTAASLETS